MLVFILLLELQSTRFTHERTTSNIHKMFHSPILFFNYEMILRTFNCTVVNQIKSSKKTRGKIENKKSAVTFRLSAVVFAREQMSNCVTVALRFKNMRSFARGFIY